MVIGCIGGAKDASEYGIHKVPKIRMKIPQTRFCCKPERPSMYSQWSSWSSCNFQQKEKEYVIAPEI